MSKKQPSLYKHLIKCSPEQLADELGWIPIYLTVPAFCIFIRKFLTLEKSEFPEETKQIIRALHGQG